MGMSQDLIDGLSAAFDGDLSDAVHSFTYQSQSTGVINPSTGVRDSASVIATGRGIPDELNSVTISNTEAGRIGDIELTFLSSELIDSSSNIITPVTDGKVTLRSKVFAVINNPISDPSGTVSTIMLRG